MFTDWFSSRRKKLLQQPAKDSWVYWMADNVWHWHVLNQAQRDRLHGLVNIFVQEKSFEGCDGLVVTDEMRVTIAAAACVLLVGFDDTYCFDKAKTLLIYPRPMVQRNLRGVGGVVDPDSFASGMATLGGTIVLSWLDVIRDCRDEQSVSNIVVHEFAHHVDGIDGDMEGIPPFPTQQLRDQWQQLAEAELNSLREAIELQQPTVLDPYGAESLAELFAVASEAFYCDGLNLYEQHKEMYALLETLYKVDPKQWFSMPA